MRFEGSSKPTMAGCETVSHFFLLLLMGFKTLRSFATGVVR